MNPLSTGRNWPEDSPKTQTKENMKTKTTLLTLLLCASGVMAQMTPPGGTNSGTYTPPPPPPTEGYTFKGVPAPNGELPWFRALQPTNRYDGTNLNHLAALGNHLVDWTNEQAISPDNVLLLKYPKSVTNQTAAWLAGTIHHWWVATNGSTEIVVSNSLDVYIQPHDDWFAGTLTSARFQGTYQDPNTNFVPDLVWKRFYGTIRNDSTTDISEQILPNLDATNVVTPVIPQGVTTNISFYLGRLGYGDTNVAVDWKAFPSGSTPPNPTNATTLGELVLTPDEYNPPASYSSSGDASSLVVHITDANQPYQFIETAYLNSGGFYNPFSDSLQIKVSWVDNSYGNGHAQIAAFVGSGYNTNGHIAYLPPGQNTIGFEADAVPNYPGAVHSDVTFTLTQLNHTNSPVSLWQPLFDKAVDWEPPTVGLEINPVNVGDLVWDGTQLKVNYTILTNSYPMDLSPAIKHMMMTNDATIWPAITSLEHTGPGLYLMGHPGDTWAAQTTPALDQSWTTLTNSATLNPQGEGNITLPLTDTNQMRFYRLQQ